MANIYSLQLLRNGAAYANKATAKQALEQATALGSVSNKDGVAVLARYVADNKVKTLVGFYAAASAMTDALSGASYMTIIDVEGAAESVDELREEIENILGDGVSSGNTVSDQLAALSGDTGSTSAETSVEGAKKYADEKIAEALDALDYNLAKDGNKVVVSLNQTDGAISGESVNITSVKLDGYAEADAVADIANTDTLGEALGKLQKTIHDMDLAVVSGDGEVITAVSEADGKVSASKTAIKDVVLTGFVADTGITGDVAATDDVENAINKLNNKIVAAQSATTVYSTDNSINVTTGTTGTEINVNIKEGEKVLAKDGNAGLYTDLDFVKITTGLPETIKERYQLLATDDTQIGVNIDVPKDSHIVSINYITEGEHAQNLEYVYIDASGNTQTTYVDMSELVLETEFASGVTVTNHIAHGVVDPTSETFLTVGTNGFKLSGVQDAISGAVQTLDASVSGGTTVGTATAGHVQVVVDEVDGKLTAVTVTEANIADADDLAALSAKTVTELTSTNSSISVAPSNAADGTITYNVITDASKIQMSGWTADASGLTAISASDSVVDAFKDVEAAIIALSSGSSEALDDEIETREAIEGQSGDTYTANSGKKYISGATSLNDADVKLNDAIENIEDNFIDGVKVNNVALQETDNVVNVEIEASSSYTASNNAIIVDTDSSTGKVTLSLGTLDCGTY